MSTSKMPEKLGVADLIARVEQMTVGEIVEFIKAAEEKFGVSAAAPVAVAAAPGAAAAAPVEEKTEFTVKLESFGEKKIDVIKAVRAITNLGLGEAKSLVEKAPVVLKEGVSKAESEEFKKAIEAAGGIVVVQ